MFFLKSFSVTVLLAITFPICVKTQTTELHVVTIFDSCAGTNFSGTPTIEIDVGIPLVPNNTNTDQNTTVTAYTFNEVVSAIAYLSTGNCTMPNCTGSPNVHLNLHQQMDSPSLAFITLFGPPSPNAPAVTIEFANPGSSNELEVIDEQGCFSRNEECNPNGTCDTNITNMLQCSSDNLGVNIYFCPLAAETLNSNLTVGSSAL